MQTELREATSKMASNDFGEDLDNAHSVKFICYINTDGDAGEEESKEESVNEDYSELLRKRLIEYNFDVLRGSKTLMVTYD